MNFMFKWQEPYLTSERSERVGYGSCQRVMFFLLYKQTDDGVFDDFPNISDHFPKMSEDFRRFPKTFEEDPKKFRWYTNEFKYNLRDKLDIIEIIDIFTYEDIMSSFARISYRFYQFVTTRYTTDFYINKQEFTCSAVL